MARIVMSRIALGIVLLALAGCAQPAAYAPRGPGQQTGYTDRQLAPNRWRVTFTGNSATPREQVEDDLLLRAAEVTLAAGWAQPARVSRVTTRQGATIRTMADLLPRI